MPTSSTPQPGPSQLQSLRSTSTLTSVVPDISSTGSAAAADGAAAEYDDLRKRLERLNSEDEKDMRAIDQTIDRLAEVQRSAKAANGLIGNNPLD